MKLTGQTDSRTELQVPNSSGSCHLVLTLVGVSAAPCQCVRREQRRAQGGHPQEAPGSAQVQPEPLSHWETHQQMQDQPLSHSAFPINKRIFKKKKTSEGPTETFTVVRCGNSLSELPEMSVVIKQGTATQTANQSTSGTWER